METLQNISGTSEGMDSSIQTSESSSAESDSSSYDETSENTSLRSRKIVQKTKTWPEIVKAEINKYFRTMKLDVKKLQIDSVEKMTNVVDAIYNKSVKDYNVTARCATLCKQLSSLAVPQSKMRITFRKLVLGKCQREFERNFVEFQHETLNETTKAVKKTEIKDKKEEARGRKMGNVILICELFQVKLLQDHIIHYVIDVLLKNEDEVSLECLCFLLLSIGQTLKQKESGNSAKYSIDNYFKILQEIVDTRPLSMSAQLMVKEAIEASHKWPSCKEDTVPLSTSKVERKKGSKHRARKKC